MKFEKQCKICGETFIAPHWNNTLCSDECRKISRKNNYAKWCDGHKERIKEYTQRKRKSGCFKCRICNKGIYEGKRNYHEECVVNKAIEGIMNGQQRNSKKYKENIDVFRACNSFQYSMLELKKIMKKRGIETE